METLKKLLIFPEKKLFSPPREKFLIFQETEAPIKPLIFSQKKAFLIFQETPKKHFETKE